MDSRCRTSCAVEKGRLWHTQVQQLRVYVCEVLIVVAEQAGSAAFATLLPDSGASMIWQVCDVISL
jgi:hypothetical protein